MFIRHERTVGGAERGEGSAEDGSWSASIGFDGDRQDGKDSTIVMGAYEGGTTLSMGKLC